jgi:hypothetical protein
MADGGGLGVLARENGGEAFIAGTRRLGVSCAPRRGTVTAWPEYNTGRAMTCGGRPPLAQGGAAVRPMGKRRVAWQGGAPTSCTGADERDALTNRRGPASACVYNRYGGMPTRPGASSAATSCAQGALALKQFNVALFACLFLTICELKCSKC